MKIINYIARISATPKHPIYEQIAGRIAEAEEEHETVENRRGL